MDTQKKKRLQAAGYFVGDVQEFLGLTDAEAAVVKVKVALARRIRELRRERKVSQTVFAKRIGSSQSRVAKMEVADPTVGAELMMKALFAIGATAQDIAQTILDIPDLVPAPKPAQKRKRTKRVPKQPTRPAARRTTAKRQQAVALRT